MTAVEQLIHFPPSCHRDTLALYRYWLEKCRGRRMPSRADLDPIDMPRRLLPWMTLVDVVPDQRRYVYRLVGTGEVEARGNDPTGKSVMDAFCAPSAENALSCYDTVVSTRAPLLDPEHFVTPNGLYATEETLFLPLSDDGVNVNMVLVFYRSRYATPSGRSLAEEQRAC